MKYSENKGQTPTEENLNCRHIHPVIYKMFVLQNLIQKDPFHNQVMVTMKNQNPKTRHKWLLLSKLAEHVMIFSTFLHA